MYIWRKIFERYLTLKITLKIVVLMYYKLLIIK